MEGTMDIIFRLVALLIVFAFGWIAKKVGNALIALLKSKLDAEQDAQLDKFIDELTAAADQMYKDGDPLGEIRREYVHEQLIKAGYQLTDAIIAKIESSVFRLPHDITKLLGEVGENQ